MAVHPGSQWLDRNWNELRNFNNQWVAARGDGLITSAETLEGLLKYLEAGVSLAGQGRPISLESVTLFFVTFDINQ